MLYAKFVHLNVFTILSYTILHKHKKQFCLKPNEKFCQWAGKKARFFVELRLFKREGECKGYAYPTCVVNHTQ